MCQCERGWETPILIQDLSKSRPSKPTFCQFQAKRNQISLDDENDCELRYGLVVRIPGSHPGGPGSIPGNGKLFEKIFSWKAFLSSWAQKLQSRQVIRHKKNIASAGNRTRINCLEGSYADHYTTDAVLLQMLKITQSISQGSCPWANLSSSCSLGDIAQW